MTFYLIVFLIHYFFFSFLFQFLAILIKFLYLLDLSLFLYLVVFDYLLQLVDYLMVLLDFVVLGHVAASQVLDNLVELDDFVCDLSELLLVLFYFLFLL